MFAGLTGARAGSSGRTAGPSRGSSGAARLLQRFAVEANSLVAAAHANGVGVMGIRAVQAGALTTAIDRELPADHPEIRDYNLAAGFRALCAEISENPAIVAHRYALALPIDTLVLGVKNRAELAGCIAAADAGPLPADLVARVDATVPRP